MLVDVVTVNLPSFVMMPLPQLVPMVCLVLHMVVASDANISFISEKKFSWAVKDQCLTC